MTEHGKQKPGYKPATLYLYLLGALFLGVSALTGGGMLILDPSGESLSISLSYLDGSPFSNYLVPGLILFTVFGVGSFSVIYGLVRRHSFSWLGALGLGFGQVVWIVVQIAIIGETNLLHLIYGGLGLALGVLALTPSFRSYSDVKELHR
jgi:hypothetical protein